MDHTSDNLISDLRRLYSGENTTHFGVFDFIHAFGSPVEAMAYAKLCWPDCIVVDEMVFRSDVVEDEDDVTRIRDAFQRSSGDYAGTERSFNRLDVPDGVFGVRRHESSDAVEEQLAQTLAQMWEARLRQLYPARQFSVELDRDSDGQVSLTFCQMRSG